MNICFKRRRIIDTLLMWLIIKVLSSRNETIQHAHYVYLHLYAFSHRSEVKRLLQAYAYLLNNSPRDTEFAVATPV